MRNRLHTITGFHCSTKHPKTPLKLLWLVKWNLWQLSPIALFWSAAQQTLSFKRSSRAGEINYHLPGISALGLRSLSKRFIIVLTMMYGYFLSSERLVRKSILTSDSEHYCHLRRYGLYSPSNCFLTIKNRSPNSHLFWLSVETHQAMKRNESRSELWFEKCEDVPQMWYESIWKEGSMQKWHLHYTTSRINEKHKSVVSYCDLMLYFREQ